MVRVWLIIILSLIVATTALSAFTTFAQSEPFKCKTHKHKGYSDLKKDYEEVDQVCPAHDNNFSEGREVTGPLYIVIHNTDGNSTKSAIKTFQNKNRAASAHYVVGPDKNNTIRIIQMVGEKDQAFHAGGAFNRKLNGKTIDNANSIGIEIVGRGESSDWPSADIYTSVASLVKDIAQRAKAAGMDIELDRDFIVGHEEINNGGKWDPGPNWNWELFMENHLGGTYKAAMQLTAERSPFNGIVELQLRARANGRDGFRIERSNNQSSFIEIQRLSNVSRLEDDNAATVDLPADEPSVPEISTEFCYRVIAYIDSKRGSRNVEADYVNPSNEACVVLGDPFISTALTQFKSDGETGIQLGGTTDESTVVMKGGVSDPSGNALQLEVEVQPIGTDFTGSPTCTSGPSVPSGEVATATCSDLANGSYHWQARARNSEGIASEWLSAGGNAENDADFLDFDNRTP